MPSDERPAERLRWALVVAARDGHRSREAEELARALTALGLLVRRPPPLPFDPGPLPVGVPQSRADVVVLDAVHSLEIAGEGLRAAAERAGQEARILVLVFREDQLIRGTEGLGLGPPVATRIEGEHHAAREAFLG